MERFGCFYAWYVDIDSNNNNNKKNIHTKQCNATNIESITSVKLHENKKHNKQNDEKSKYKI